MSQSPSVSQAVADVAAMIKTGNLPKAKRTMALLLDNVHPSVLALLNQCADILSRPTAIARPKLTALWRQHAAHPETQKIIVACAPARDEWDNRRVPELSADDHPQRATTPAPRPVATHSGKPVSREELRARRDRRQATKDTAAYFAHRAGIEEGQPPTGDRPDGYANDHDKDALALLRGTPCVSCWMERSAADQDTSRSDDGLCCDCREKGRPGIPELPADHTRTDAITARCAHIADKYHPATARAILRNEWHRARTTPDRATIADWVQANNATVDAPAERPRAAQSPAPCTTCGGTSNVRHGQCTDCRTLDTDPSMPAARRYQRRPRQALPPNTVYVGRPTPFGNPFRCEPTPAARAEAVRQYQQWISTQPELIERARAELAGRTLACWCPTDGPCHADVLLELIDAPAAVAA